MSNLSNLVKKKKAENGDNLFDTICWMSTVFHCIPTELLKLKKRQLNVLIKWWQEEYIPTMNKSGGKR
jgi:hypothetical protein